MTMVYFKYKEHPCDFFRNTDVTELPNPQEDLESFLVQFLPSYQSDERIAFLDDMYKLKDDDFFDEKNQLGPKRLIKSELGSVKLLLVMI